jgi:hypothetical protein
MSTEESDVVELYMLGVVSKRYILEQFGYWIEEDDDRKMEITIEEMEN